jgi:enamine deaminase RidA (YjgF/YER057c/UK114 family)
VTDRSFVVPPGYEVQYEQWGLTPALRVGTTVYCSGQLGVGEDGSLPSDTEAQLVNAFTHVENVLAAAGAGLDDIVELSSFHVGLVAQLETFAQVRDRFLGEHRPAQTAVGVAELGLPGAVVEIKATAILKTASPSS